MKLEVQPVYGWGWSCATGARAEVPPPFILEVVATDRDGFKTAVGHIDQDGHPLASHWIVLSPLGAAADWSFSHVCAFVGEPSIPDDADKLAALGKLIKSAGIAGFARIASNTGLP